MGAMKLSRVPGSRVSGVILNRPPKLMDLVSLNQVPIAGTKYTLLDTVKNVRINKMTCSVNWTLQPNPLEVHLTIDGVAYTATFANPATATSYYLYQRAIYGSSLFDITTASSALSTYVAFLFEARSCKIELETTGGTVQFLRGAVSYSKY